MRVFVGNPVHEVMQKKMATLADKIEAYLQYLLQNSKEGVIEVQRQQLAEIFACVPSQINYVLSTRFTVNRGYLVESRRGGGGYVRITRLTLSSNAELRHLIREAVGDLVSQDAAEDLLQRLQGEGLLTVRERLLLQAAISRWALPLDLPQRDVVRASILRAVLLTLLREDFPQEEV